MPVIRDPPRSKRDPVGLAVVERGADALPGRAGHGPVRVGVRACRRPRRTGRPARSGRPGSATPWPRRGGRATSAMTRRSTRRGSPAAHAQQAGVVERRRLGRDRGLSPPQLEPRPGERLVQRARLEVGGHDDVGGAPDEDRRARPPPAGHRPGAGAGPARPGPRARIARARRLGVRGGADLPREQPRARRPALALASRGRTPSGGRRSGARAARPRTCRAPGSARTRPSSARRCIALRAVIRLTPNSRHRSASDGSRSPGAQRGHALAQRQLDLAVVREPRVRGHHDRPTACSAPWTAAPIDAGPGAELRRDERHVVERGDDDPAPELGPDRLEQQVARPPRPRPRSRSGRAR